jgi:hypothetical protein
MDSEFELLCFQVLDASRNHLMSDDNGMRAPYGWRYRSAYVEMAGEAVCAHLLQRGFVSSQTQYGATCYRINAKGQTEWQRLRNPEDFTQGLRADIARLETQLTAKRAALAALDERGAMTEAGITRLIGDSLQNGE